MNVRIIALFGFVVVGALAVADRGSIAQAPSPPAATEPPAQVAPIQRLVLQDIQQRQTTIRVVARSQTELQTVGIRRTLPLFPIDLADPATPVQILDHLASHGRQVDALVNNAGYGHPGLYSSTAWEDQAAFLRVLLQAPSELAHRVLPGMIERKFGRILNVASLAGLVPGSGGHTLYGAVKSYLVKFSQSLHLENLSTGVHVTALCPGFTWSEFHDVNGTREQINRSTPDWLWLGADEVAETGFEAVEANRCISVPGAPNKAIAAIAKLLPDDWSLALMASQGSRFRKI